MTDRQSNPSEQITAAVSSWPDVEVGAHRFGGVEFRLGRRELGHLHGDRIADLPFPRRVRDELIAAGRARPHHVLPDSGWVTLPIAGSGGAEDAIELFRLAYDRALDARRARTSSAPARRSNA
jgi:Luciferase